jgi:hypothetical protein
MGLFNKSSTTNQSATTNNYDQRQVYDAGGGIIGSNNKVDKSTTLNEQFQTTSNSNNRTNVTSYGTDPGVQHINDTNAALLATLGQQQGDSIKVIAGLGADGIKQMGESATSLYGMAEQNSAQVWTHTLDASQEAMDKMFSAAQGVLGASTSLAQGAMSTYQPADSKASDNQTKIAILGVIAIIVAAFIQSKKG